MNTLPGSGYRIMGNTANGPDVESNCATREAANNRLRMLNRRYPRISFWIEPVPVESVCEKTLIMPRVTVERIPS
jgi:hypothetical protein